MTLKTREFWEQRGRVELSSPRISVTVYIPGIISKPYPNPFISWGLSFLIYRNKCGIK